VSEVDYSDYSKAELQAAADEAGVEYSADDTKAELIAKLEDAEAGDSEEADETPDEEAAEDAAPVEGVASFASEDFPELRPIEPDVADIPPEEYDGEITPPLNAESWVILDGSHPDIGERWDGKIASVLSWPVSTEHDPDTGETKVYTSPDGYYLVQERSQGARFSVQADAFKSIHTNGRPEVLGFA